MNNKHRKARIFRITAATIAFVMIFAMFPLTMKADGETETGNETAAESTGDNTNESREEVREYTITYKMTGSGKLSGDEKASAGQKVKLTVKPDENFALKSIKADFDGFALNDKNEFIMPDRDVTVTAEFEQVKKNTYTIVSSFKEGGTVKPAFQTVEEGDSCLFAINADEGYEVRNVYIDGVPVGNVPFYIFNNVDSSHIIIADFVKKELPAEEKEEYEVKFFNYDGTLLSVQTVEKGKSAEEPETPEREGYTFKGWDKDFSSVTKNVAVIAVFEKDKEPEPEKTDEEVTKNLLLSVNGSDKLIGLAVEVHEIGDKISLKAVPDPKKDASGTVWTSSDSKVALVSSDGTVAVIGTGSATITASFEGKTASYIIVCMKKTAEVKNPETADD